MLMEVMLKVWAYVLDVFKPINISTEELFNAVSSDPLKIFDTVKEVLKSTLKRLRTLKYITFT